MVTMTRRTKREMELMKDDATCYLLQTNLNAHQAHELMIKEHLESGKSIPYYIKGVKDFIKVSQELAVEWNRRDMMAKKDAEKAMEKETIVDYIMNLNVSEMKAIYSTYKNTVSNSDKIVLNDVYMMIYSCDMDRKYINQHTINVFSNIMNEIQQETISKTLVEEEAPTNTEVKTLVDTHTTNEYKTELFSSIDQHNNHELSDIAYSSLEAAHNEIKLFTKTTQDKDTVMDSSKSKLIIGTTEDITDCIPQTKMIADYANIVFEGNKVNVVFTNSEDKTIATFKYRRSWSNRKYIDQVFKQSKIIPSWDFRYVGNTLIK